MLPVLPVRAVDEAVILTEQDRIQSAILRKVQGFPATVTDAQALASLHAVQNRRKRSSTGARVPAAGMSTTVLSTARSTA